MWPLKKKIVENVLNTGDESAKLLKAREAFQRVVDGKITQANIFDSLITENDLCVRWDHDNVLGDIVFRQLIIAYCMQTTVHHLQLSGLEQPPGNFCDVLSKDVALLLGKQCPHTNIRQLLPKTLDLWVCMTCDHVCDGERKAK